MLPQGPRQPRTVVRGEDAGDPGIGLTADQQALDDLRHTRFADEGGAHGRPSEGRRAARALDRASGSTSASPGCSVEWRMSGGVGVSRAEADPGGQDHNSGKDDRTDHSVRTRPGLRHRPPCSYCVASDASF